MERKYIYGGVALVVIIFILFLIMRKKGTDSSSSTGDTNVGPTIEVSELQATQNPDKSDNTVTKTESYVIQSSEGYDATQGTFDDKELSKNIQLSLMWNNGGGWDEINKIIIKWEQEVSDETDDTKTKNVERMRHVISKSASENATYFTQYASGLTHTFQANKKFDGNDVPNDKKFSAVGKNMIHVYYVDKDKNEVRLTGDDVPSYTVTVDMLSATKDLLSAKTYTYKPTTGGATISANITEHEYYLYSSAVKKDIINHIDSSKYGTVVLLPEGESANNSTVRLKVNFKNSAGDSVANDGKEYFLMRGSDDGKIIIKDVTDVTNFTEQYKFEVVTGKSDDYIRLRRVGNNNKDKFMMIDFADDKKLKIKSYTVIDDACTNKSLDFLLSASKVSTIPSCVSGLDFNDGDSLGTTNYIYNKDDPKNDSGKLVFSLKNDNGKEIGWIYLKLKDGEPDVKSGGKATFFIKDSDDDDDYIPVSHVPKPEQVTGEWQDTSVVAYRGDFTVSLTDYDTKYHLYKRLFDDHGLYKFESLGYFQLQE